jgi:predicted ATP-dependent protease
VEAAHVKRALEEKAYRSNMIEKKIQDLIEEGTIFIDTKDKEVGQINGLSVIDLGDYMFGNPSRITARTFVGKGNIINIEREAKMSGRIHSKGVLILSGYLGDKFAQDKPLALSASICFEQLYEEVEGDSASSTELYCLLSSLSDLPLRQDIAVTGSVDQRGKIQPIGGVNQKIEGFYDVCKAKGLTGSQGVMIPQANVKHLMLKDEIVQAVKEKRFHIYPVETIDEGIEILTGYKAGVKQKNGKYAKGTVNYKVNQRLEKYAKIATSFGKK